VAAQNRLTLEKMASADLAQANGLGFVVRTSPWAAGGRIQPLRLFAAY